MDPPLDPQPIRLGEESHVLLVVNHPPGAGSRQQRRPGLLVDSRSAC